MCLSHAAGITYQVVGIVGSILCIQLRLLVNTSLKKLLRLFVGDGIRFIGETLRLVDQ